MGILFTLVSSILDTYRDTSFSACLVDVWKIRGLTSYLELPDVKNKWRRSKNQSSKIQAL